MKISLIQMDMRPAEPQYNFKHAAALIRKTVAEQHPDTVVLPETWNSGFFPRENLSRFADCCGEQVKGEIGALAAELNVNIVAGSVSDQRGGRVYNTSYVFDRQGTLIAEYSKTHLFTPMGEHDYFTPGNHLCRFTLDGAQCGIIICYDIRFPELTRSLTLGGDQPLDLLFVVAQWPNIRIPHLQVLTTARAIENQMFVACCNSCGKAGETQYGGCSAIIDPWGNTLAQADGSEQIISAEADFSGTAEIRGSINVFRDRRPELYRM